MWSIFEAFRVSVCSGLDVLPADVELFLKVARFLHDLYQGDTVQAEKTSTLLHNRANKRRQ